MQAIRKIKGALIESIYTKFYYRKGHLWYQIVMNYAGGKVFFKDFAEYEEYKHCHDFLLDIMYRKDKQEVAIDFVFMEEYLSAGVNKCTPPAVAVVQG